jgi:hypothetical protein
MVTATYAGAAQAAGLTCMPRIGTFAIGPSGDLDEPGSIVVQMVTASTEGPVNTQVVYPTVTSTFGSTTISGTPIGVSLDAVNAIDPLITGQGYTFDVLAYDLSGAVLVDQTYSLTYTGTYTAGSNPTGLCSASENDWGVDDALIDGAETAAATTTTAVPDLATVAAGDGVSPSLLPNPPGGSRYWPCNVAGLGVPPNISSQYAYYRLQTFPQDADLTELHVWNSMSESFSYSVASQTTIGAEVSIDGKAWHASGSVNMNREGSLTVDPGGYTTGKHDRYVTGNFQFDEVALVHYAWDGSVNDYSCFAQNYKTSPSTWNGSISYTSDASLVSADGCNMSYDVHRQRFNASAGVDKESALDHEYSAAATIHGVNISEKNTYGTAAHLHWSFGTTYTYGYLCWTSSPTSLASATGYIYSQTSNTPLSNV